MGAELGVELTRARIAELVREDAASWQRLNDRMMRWLRALIDAGVPTAILSNMSRDTWELARPTFDGVGCVTLSFEVGAVKPEPGIYRACLSALGVEPEEALFLDDRPENVAGARALGMHALLFEGEEALRAELERRELAWPLP